MWGNLEPKAVVGGGGGVIPDVAGDAADAGMPMAASELHSNLLRVVGKAVEDMVFMPVEGRKSLSASVAVESPVSGRVRFCLSEKLARDLAAAMFSADSAAIDKKMVMDAVAELVNTVAGQLLEMALPPDQTFSLGLPEVSTVSEIEQDGLCRSVFLRVEEENFLAIIEGGELVKLCDQTFYDQ